jgi:hypothetical protein
LSEYQVRVVIDRVDNVELHGNNVKVVEIDSDLLETFSSQSGAEDYLQWVADRADK